MSRVRATGLTRAYPVGLGLALARLRAARAWHRPDERESALRHLELLVGRTSRAGEVERLARRYLYQTRRYQELVWRTRTVTSLPVRHLDRLRLPIEAGNGVILSVVHQGQFGGAAASIARHGLPVTVLVAPALFGPQDATLRGVLRRQLFTVFSSGAGVTVLSAAGSYAPLRAVLHAGGTVLLACDLKGSTPVQFLGRTVLVPSGTARLALETGAPVLPVSAVPDGHLERLEIGQALLPGHYADHRELLQAVLRRHEPAVLAWPEAMERPRSHFLLAAESPPDPDDSRVAAGHVDRPRP